MSGGEIVWRMVCGYRDAALWSRMAVGSEPTPPRRLAEADPTPVEGGFTVCDVALGEWVCPKSEDEQRWRDCLVARGEQIREHRLSFLGLRDCNLGDPVDWNRDYSRGVKIPLLFAPLIDYRDYHVAGDAKLVWELNRHHHLVVLGRAYRVTGDARYASAAVEQLESWIAQCPFGRGMNWRSPLELAIRLINWVWTIDLIRESNLITAPLWERLRRTAYLHLWQITQRYSRGTSANNHLIGEATGVFVGTSYFRDLDRRGRWRQHSKEVLEQQILAQTFTDGISREQALGYHVFVLQFFLLAGVVARETGDDFSSAYWCRLERMLDCLAVFSEGGTELPMIGDSDDGYVLDIGAGAPSPQELFSIGAVLFCRADLKALAGAYGEPARWLLGSTSRSAFELLPEASGNGSLTPRAFSEAGYYLLQYGRSTGTDRVSAVFDCGDLGFTSIAAHGHADALSFTLRAFGTDIFVDPGTYDYFSFPTAREYFRSTRAHNTVEVDGVDQSVMLGPFLWGHRAHARCVVWEPTPEGGRVVGEHNGYVRLDDPVVHRRALSLNAPSQALSICDEIFARGEHDIAIYFHLAEHATVTAAGRNCYRITVRGGSLMLELDSKLKVETLRGRDAPMGGWVSRAYHQKAPTTTFVARTRSRGDCSFTSRIKIG